MITISARGTDGPTEPFHEMTLELRDPGPTDVLIDIAYTGVCHSDIAHVRSKWGHSVYPLVPGHEIAGTVAAVGSAVTKYTVGDRVGVGCMVDSCRECDACLAGHEQHCRKGHIKTYGMLDRNGVRTQGGYSQKIVCDEDFVVRIPDAIPLPNAAPLMCAGVTLFSPLHQLVTKPGTRVAIVGFGGLGHVGVKIAAAMGAEVTVLDLDDAKREDALRLGATDFRTTVDEAVFTELASTQDVVISTVPAALDWDKFLGLLRLGGTMVLVGVPGKPLTINAFSLITNGRSLMGTRFGGIAVTQEMLDFCGEHGIGAEVEVIDADSIDAAFERVTAGDVRYRFVIDISTL